MDDKRRCSEGGRQDGVVSIADALRDLRIVTSRLQLRLADSSEWQTYAAAIAGRVVPPESTHFVGAWAQLVSPRFEQEFVAARDRTLSTCTRDRWGIELGAFAGTQLVGQASLYARDWPVSREVITASGVHPDRRARGLGTEMRAAVLLLAFDVLGANVAWSGASVDNVASNRISEKLGYELVGHETKRTGAGDVLFTRLRLAADAWIPSTAVRVVGDERVRALLR